MQDLKLHDVLVQYPLVSEDSPEWKKVCPFCGEYNCVHEVEDTCVCHWCHANWIEHDTGTERQIQILNLNHGKMPRWGEGDMPIVERVFGVKENYRIEINFATMTATLFGDDGSPAIVRSLTDKALSVLFSRKVNKYDECA